MFVSIPIFRKYMGDHKWNKQYLQHLLQSSNGDNYSNNSNN